MPVEIVCADCGSAYEPSRSDLVAGPIRYRSCPDCRTPQTYPCAVPIASPCFGDMAPDEKGASDANPQAA